jgi:ATP-dependent RNA helicase RhlE
MFYSSNKFHSLRGGPFRGRRDVRQAHKPKFFDPSIYIDKSKKVNNLSSNIPQIEDKFIPVNDFSDFAITERLKLNISKRGFLKPTPIQDQTIPQILAGKDLVGIANTGTGKTAAFLIPLIQKAATDSTQKILIIVPTRELAVQIKDEFEGFAHGMHVFSVLCIGGVNIHNQVERLRMNPQFVIGTPGRLKDLEKNRKINFSNFNNIVLDEVDRMLDIGFVREIKYIISLLKQNRQSLFFSATITKEAEDIMHSFLANPVMVSVKSTDNLINVHQEVIKTNGQSKIELLHDLLIKDGFSKVLVFGRTKFGMEKLARSLGERGFAVAAIHGNKNQNQRLRALNEFKNNRIQVLLATDVASRGLDINDVTHVINYDLPESYEDYIHRIGRTGRANKFGAALTFVD